MKKKKSMIFLALLVAVFVLGVGYAAVSGVNLTLNGSAATETKDLDVAFNGTTSQNANGTGATVTPTVEIPSGAHGTKQANLEVTGLKAVGDTVTATYTIENFETDLSADITTSSITVGKSEFFEVTTNIDDSTGTPTRVAAGATTNLVVTVRVKKLPILEADSTTSISVVLDAEPVQPSA